MAKEIISVPMQYKTDGFHEGHLKILDYAGKPEVVVLPKTYEYRHYFEGSLDRLEIPRPLKQMGQDVSKLGLKMRLLKFYDLSLEQRIDMFASASAFVNQYKDKLPSDYLRRRCIYSLASATLPIDTSSYSFDISTRRVTVRGPEPNAFFVRAVGNLYGLNHTEIMPTIIKDPNYRIKAQDSINLLNEVQKDSLRRIQPMLRGAIKRAHIGSNPELVKEICASYKHRHWKLMELVVMEGGIIPGRIEFAAIRYLNTRAPGTIMIEEIDYYV